VGIVLVDELVLVLDVGVIVVFLKNMTLKINNTHRIKNTPEK